MSTLNGVNLAQIAQKSLSVLQARPSLLSRFSTSFSPEVSAGGQSTITTRYVVAPVVQDIASGYAPTAVSTISRTMTLNNFWGYVVGLTDTEVTESQIDIQRLFTGPSAISTVNKIEALVFALITNATYSQKATVTIANFDADVVADLAQTLNTANAPSGNRTLVLLPTAVASLMKDSSVKSALNYGQGAPIVDGFVGRLHGFDVVMNSTIPTNSENLFGFACAPEALCVAARGVTTPMNFPGQVENVVEPMSGLPLQYRYWYNPDAASQPGSHNFSCSCVSGQIAGVPANLVRLVTA